MEEVEVAQGKKPMGGQHEAVAQCQLNVGIHTVHPPQRCDPTEPGVHKGCLIPL